MAAYTFQEIVSGATKSGVFQTKTRQSLDWFAAYARNFKIGGGDLMRGEKENLQNSLPPVGSLCMFFYDAKTKDKLPYWDRFPCIFVIERYKDGSWLGINLHYLNYVARAKLMDALYNNSTAKNLTSQKKLAINYSILKNSTKYTWFKPCVKRYLPGHIKSRFLKIPPENWNLAVMLPLQNFEKASSVKVWSDSQKHYIG
jgi:hypothetical protein